LNSTLSRSTLVAGLAMKASAREVLMRRENRTGAVRNASRGQLQERIEELEAENETLHDQLDSIAAIVTDDEEEDKDEDEGED
jgi:cell division protein FtsB